ncbi:DHH family phosphoesterase [Effusibacillus pohliae]|uniref:DHH family phosphoesterase n=1 Tax=Effusibacillus pohliae TaxID=232270 RepID=UPI000381981C|nr:DHH family phosphoesterase [Effusibacillus pohliae]
MKSFLEELTKIRGGKNLILCHDQADSDAIGAAYALSRWIGGDIGVPQAVASHTKKLIEELGMSVIHGPNVCDYPNIVVVDTAHAAQLCDTKPQHFFVIDHHPNNHLIEKADAALYDTVSSTSQLVYRMLRELQVPIDKKMALALCAGILTDTIHFHRGDAEAFQAFGDLLQIGGLRYQDVQNLYIVEDRRHRSAIIDSALTARKSTFGGYYILVAEVDTNIPTYAARALFDLGADASVVGYRNGQEVEVRMYLRHELLENCGMQAHDVFRSAPSMKKGKTWGYSLFAGFRSDHAQLDLIFDEILRVFHDRLTE